MEPRDIIGMETPNGWRIQSVREPYGFPTSICHSWTFIAQNNSGESAFVKALNIHIDNSNDDVQKALQELSVRIDRFRYEWELADKCNQASLSGVVRALEYGSFSMDSYSNPIPFLVFELAEMDLREQADLERRFDLSFRLRTLHKTTVGLSQLHAIQIAHQDLKPSNIVVFERQTKISDLGSAHHKVLTKPELDSVVDEDITYAPPEMLYRANNDGWENHRLAADLYLLGSIATFLITGIGMTQLIRVHLKPEHWWVEFNDSYEHVLPYLHEAMGAALDEIYNAAEEEIAEEICLLIKYLCNLDPTKRGHPKNQAGMGARYGLERFISRFDYLATKAEYFVTRRRR